MSRTRNIFRDVFVILATILLAYINSKPNDNTSHCIVQPLSKGYKVRASLRSLEKK